MKKNTNNFSKGLMRPLRKRTRFIAAFFAVNMLLEVVAPLKLWALTGGPSQPEVNSFEPIGTTEMVDLFSGDFNYNIPLFDVGGYPINISYHAGINMDQEASWVGLGWNINPGSITRGMRGIPDDFLSEDVVKTMSMKGNTTLALNFNTDLEIFGFSGMEKRNKSKLFAQDNSYKQLKTMNKLSKTQIGFGVVLNNYKGVGYSLDLSTEISKTNYISERDYWFNSLKQKNYFDNLEYYKNSDYANSEGIEEANYKQALIKKNMRSGTNQITRGTKGLKADLDFSASSQEGFNMNVSFSKNLNEKEKLWTSVVPSIGLGYNSFLGLTGFEAGFVASRDHSKIIYNNHKYDYRTDRSFGSSLPIGNYTYTPTIGMPTLSTSNSFNATVGFDAFGGHPDMRFSGFYNTEELANSQVTVEAYGYLYENEIYWNRGKDNIMMDFNREKESNGNKNASHLPLANHTYDIYSVTGQGTGGMYRPHRKTIGLLHDKFTENKNKPWNMNDLGIELGFGSNFHLGTNIKNKVQRSSTGLWNSKDNELLNMFNYRMGDPDDTNSLRHRQIYFKAAGEQTPSDNHLANIWGGKKEVSLKIGKTSGTQRNLRFGKVYPALNQSSSTTYQAHTEDNPIRNNVITYLTAEECSAQGLGLDPNIISYPQNYWTNYIKNQTVAPLDYYARYDDLNGAKKHHISEIINYGGDGMRYVYGIPAYNTHQQEVSFAISKDRVGNNISERKEFPSKGLVEYSSSGDEIDNSSSNNRGSDNFLMSTEIPPYAHSYLLTGVLSPDYSDLTGNGITDDDYGSAVKFNYHKIPGKYKWRSPYEKDNAHLDQGYLTDNSDNKASYVYGEKEIWYVQSIESKTHVAEFKLSKRHDGHGVIDQNGGLDISESNCLMKLDSIVIYSKIDILVNGPRAVPVKTIVFQYDYSLCPGIPNSDNSGGKLTLKSIYFTYGNSSKGVLNPYKFTYSSFNPTYSHTQYDRWGNYKYATEKLPNRDFPYQDFDISRDTFDNYASAWNLTNIELPSGGEINVEYEADDYAYVQDKRAMQMFKICGATSELNLNFKANKYTSSRHSYQTTLGQLYDGGKDNTYLYFKINDPIENVPDDRDSSREYFKKLFLNDHKGENKDMVYFRFKVNMDPAAKNADHFEYVSGYANINTDDCGFTNDKAYAYIKLIQVNQGDVGLTRCNPIAKQSWQLGLQSLRKVMYPGSDQSQAADDGSKQSAMKALVNAYGQALNVFTGPYQNLRWKKIAQNFELYKSYIRLYRPDNYKTGGGCRVKKITINDNWNSMNTEQQSGQYGQSFTYKTKNNLGEVVSSGVASYEPFVGNDENPFRVPSFYETNRFMFPDLNEYIEEPFGESFFPAANVGYSRVVVRNIPKPGTIATSTGKVVHEYFTSKDFPVICKNTPLKYLTNGGGNSSDESSKGNKKAKKFTKALVSMFNVVKRDYMVATQGYSIILNDMHGKPKSTAIFSSLDEKDDPIEKDFSGRLISGTEYKYKTEVSKNPNNFKSVFGTDTLYQPIPDGVSLNNVVWVMKEDGELEEREIATSYDIAVDTRESKSHFRHAGIDFNLESFLITIIPCPYPKYMVNQSLFQSAVMTKVVQQYGVLEEVVAYDHSSIVRTKNLVWDQQTGQVLLTATTNEFNDPIYNFTYPAHLVYDGMGPAYKNVDYETNFIVGSDGDIHINSLAYDSKFKFVEGDELLLNNGSSIKRAWVLKTRMNSTTGVYTQIRLIDASGLAIEGMSCRARIIRSGRRNLASTPVGAITTMYNQIFNTDSSYRLRLNKEIIQSSAALFSDQWQSYIDRAAFIPMVCDTLAVDVVSAYNLIKSIVDKSNSEDYVFDGSILPPNAVGLSSFNGELKKSVERYAMSNDPGCDSGNSQLLSVHFGCATENHNNFYFKAKYFCPATGDTIVDFLTCEMGVNLTDSFCGFDILDADSISNYTLDNSYTARFWAYNAGDSCEYVVGFPINNCFSKIECWFTRYCDYIPGMNLNPYVNNLKGVWRQKESFAFNSGRVYENKSNNNTNVRRDGFIKDYTEFWKFRDSSKLGLLRYPSDKWVSTGQATMYAPEGNGLEERDALGIYSSQIFGYNKLLVTAQATNARYTQIAFDNFEDYFSPVVDCDKQGHFDFREGISWGKRTAVLYDNLNATVVPMWNTNPITSKAYISRDTAHTGLHSMCIASNDSHSVVRKLDYSGFDFASGSDSFYRVINLNNVITPFAPTPGKYILSAWVYEKHSDKNSVNTYENAYVNVKVYNGGSAVVNQNFKASGMIIEDWQRIDGSFVIPTGADSIKVTLVNLGGLSAYFDDIRMHPFDSRMAGHVYHFTQLKVMAELDDNNYATFYEYDDEGSLIRVKRETENGIVTIQESRKSIRKTSN